jgi:hypothetical protein
MNIRRVVLAVVLILAVGVFGTVFYRQLRVSHNELANIFAADAENLDPVVAGSTVTNVKTSGDSLIQIERELDSVNFSGWDGEVKQLEKEAAGL